MKDRIGLAELGYGPISIVACNLYPFTAAANQEPKLDDPDLLEMIDIGGPTMVRASAKNHRNVITVCNPDNYAKVVEELHSAGSHESVSLAFRQQLALEAFEHTAAYDAAISDELHARWIGRAESFADKSEQEMRLPNALIASAAKLHTLRYGENGHQSAALYIDPKVVGTHSTLVTAHVEGGKQMSYNNYSDADATLRLCRSLSTDEWPETLMPVLL